MTLIAKAFRSAQRCLWPLLGPDGCCGCAVTKSTASLPTGEPKTPRHLFRTPPKHPQTPAPSPQPSPRTQQPHSNSPQPTATQQPAQTPRNRSRLDSVSEAARGGVGYWVVIVLRPRGDFRGIFTATERVAGGLCSPLDWVAWLRCRCSGLALWCWCHGWLLGVSYS